MKYKYGSRRRAVEYEKDFDTWNEAKKTVHKRDILPDFETRDIWWCKMGLNVGFEEDGKGTEFERPVLVFRKFNKEMLLGIPLTSVAKKNKFHFELPKYREDGADSLAILSQIRLYSANRLVRKIYRIGENTHDNLTKKLFKLMAEKANAPHAAEHSRIPNGSSYRQYSKPKAKRQVSKLKKEAK
ncbi:MAG: type II toxin-antitoxin system PemK/MazF family toxin [Candidatus Nomurabacteria bacterium]|jgi:mRNA interferase MazF|nr:type II toxin-antitoxin system PemK/MazF family toxin [Candidatus Nomurabacteria bacterium]